MSEMNRCKVCDSPEICSPKLSDWQASLDGLSQRLKAHCIDYFAGQQVLAPADAVYPQDAPKIECSCQVTEKWLLQSGESVTRLIDGLCSAVMQQLETLRIMARVSIRPTLLPAIFLDKTDMWITLRVSARVCWTGPW